MSLGIPTKLLLNITLVQKKAARSNWRGSSKPSPFQTIASFSLK